MESEIRLLHLAGATGAGREELFHGRKHLVVPVVPLIGDTVIHAVNAPTAEFVPASLLAQAPSSWNGRPLVLGHPMKNGVQISANDPEVLEKQGLGFMASTRTNGPRLGTEAWIDVARAEHLGQHKMLEDARAGRPIEVSVGAYVTTLPKVGVGNGKTYKASWNSLGPDHLALLPNGVGACSLAMGCGTGRVAEAAIPHLLTAEGIEYEEPALRAAEFEVGDSVEVLATGEQGTVSAVEDDSIDVTDVDGDTETYAADELKACGGPGSGPHPGSAASKMKDATGSHIAAAKDHARIKDILRKAPGDPAKQHALARQMANSIDKPDKAARRAHAAETHAPHLAGVFHQRFGQLNAGRTLETIEPLLWRIAFGDPTKSIIDPVTLKTLRDIPQSERDKLDTSDFAGPHESFPIVKQADVNAASRLIGHADNPDAVKAKIIAIAKRKGFSIPDAWKARAAGALPDKAQVGGSMKDCPTCSGTGEVDGASCSDCAGTGKLKTAEGKTLRQRLEALMKPFIKTLADTVEPPTESEDTAELISYEAIQELISQAEASLTSGKAQVDALVADEKSESVDDNDDVDEARLEALVSMCMQLYGTVNGIVKIATACLAPDADATTSPMQAYAAYRTAKGARHSAADVSTLQTAHDTVHDLHKHLTDLGASCNGMKLLSGGADSSTPADGSVADSNAEDTMEKTQRAATIKALTESKCGCYTEADAKWLEAMPDDRLEGLKTLADAGIKALALSKAEAEKVITDHAAASNALAMHAAGLKDKADKAKAKEDAADGGKDDSKEDDEGKMKAASALRAAEAAGFKTVEEHEQAQFYAKNPEIKTLVDRQKAADAARKAELVGALKTAQSVHDEAKLKTFDLDRLEEIAALVNVPKPDYSGRGVARAAEASDVFANPPNPWGKKDASKAVN